jgi:hypothetical protein
MLYRLWLGRAFDLGGFRSQAKVIYRDISKTDNLDIRITSQALKGLRKKFDEPALKKTMVNFFTADFIKL